MKLKKILVNLFVALVFFLGLGFVLYPKLSDLWNSMHSSFAVAGYEEQLAKLDEGDMELLLQDAQKYNESLIRDRERWVITKEKRADYLAVMNCMDNGMMGYVEIPCIEVSLPIYHGTEDTFLQIGAGHVEGSSLPVGGESTHCVIAGHRGLPSAELFTRLDEVKEGDLFTIDSLGKKFTYEVDQIKVTDPEDFKYLAIEEGEDLCTLVTCTPYGINTSRLLVRGHRIETPMDDAEASPSEMARAYRGKSIAMIAIFLCGCSGILLFLIFLQWQWKIHSNSNNKHNKKKRKRRLAGKKGAHDLWETS